MHIIHLLGKVKNKIKSVLSNYAVFNSRIRKIKNTQIDFDKLDLVRNEKVENLNNEKYLVEKFILSLGLNDENLEEFPQSLYQFCGKGLYIWQYPNQFAKYLALLSTLNIKSYLEIGIRHGGTFLLTFEYLKKFNENIKATGVDLKINKRLKKYLKNIPDILLFETSSFSQVFQNFINNNFFDLVLIDGDHSFKGCLSDYNLMKDRTNILVLHDIHNSVCPGVKEVWNICKSENPDDFYFYEFVEQYEEVTSRTGKVYLGIGIRVRKVFINL